MALTARTAPSNKPKASRIATLERRWGLLFVSPWIFGLLVFSVFPMLYSLFLSFTDYNLARPDQWKFIGLENWLDLGRDPSMQRSLMVTFRYLVIVVPFLLLSSLLMAVLLSHPNLRFRSFWVTLFFLPNLVPSVVAGLVWRDTLNIGGPINKITQWLFGWDGPRWLADASWVMPAIALIGLWSMGYTMLNLMAALKNVPKELYEAATIDGASSTRSFFTISLPLMSNVIFYNIVTGIIGGFQYFTVAFLLYNGQGGPKDAGLFYMLKLYKEAFVYLNMGFASAMAWAMLLICLVITQVLFMTSKRWVYTATEEKP